MRVLVGLLAVLAAPAIAQDVTRTDMAMTYCIDPLLASAPLLADGMVSASPDLRLVDNDAVVPGGTVDDRGRYFEVITHPGNYMGVITIADIRACVVSGVKDGPWRADLAKVREALAARALVLDPTCVDEADGVRTEIYQFAGPVPNGRYLVVGLNADENGVIEILAFERLDPSRPCTEDG